MTVRGGVHYDEARQFLIVEGLIARDIPTFPLAARPKRRARAAAFDSLAGNTTLGIHVSEVPPGGEKDGHRHLDEATFYIVSGRGWTELRQSDAKPDQRVDWEAGDMVAIPSNAWHQHYNADPQKPALQLAFKNTRFLRTVFGSREFVYQNEFRFHDRYDDEDDYWTSREPVDDYMVRVNTIERVVDEAVVPDPAAGEGVSLTRFSMGGHRTLSHTLFEIGVGGHVREHRPLAEEAMLVLRGCGRTLLRADDGRTADLEWQAGDLLAPPFGVSRRHEQLGDEPVRYLSVRNDLIERALGITGSGSLDGVLPVRWPDVLEAQRSDIEAVLEQAALSGRPAPDRAAGVRRVAR
jgi:quercetin dioxygenase-like cupin family protein